jgi:hypothetical protein
MRGNKINPYQALSYPLPLGFNGRWAGLYRWLSGRPMNGHRYTDATGFRYGTMALDVSGHATSYQLLPGALRFLYIRLPLMLAAPYLLACLLRPRESALIAVGLLALAGWRWDVWRRRRVFRREVTEPLGAALAALTNARTVAGRAHLWVDVPADFRDDPTAKIIVRLPPAWLGEDGDKKRMTAVVSTRLALDDLTATWTMKGAAPFVSYVQAPKPPALVSFEDGMRMSETAGPDELVMGSGPRDKIETFDLSLESPHLMVAGGSGAGKSELIAYLCGQWTRRGGGVAMLDAKFTSHMWARQVPGILYASEAQEMHEALVWLDSELMRRARLVSVNPAAAASLVPLMVVLEEMNAASNRLRAYWKEIKSAEDPMMSPALTALTNLASMGREMMMHIILAGQSVTAKVTGGPEARENFGGRALARATARQWAMLAPQIKPAPVKRGAPGRWHLVVGDALKEFQVPFVDLKEKQTAGAVARFLGWATGGLPIPDVPAMMADQDQVVVVDRSENPSSGTTTCTLPEYVAARGGEHLTLKRLENWRSQDREAFPLSAGQRGRAYAYEWEDLDAYVARRLGESVTAQD